MADGKNIEVKLVATGGDQAAGEVRKLTTATEQASTATRGFGGMLDSTAPEVEEVKQAASAASPEVVELSDAFKEAEANAERLLESLEKSASATDELGKASEDVAPKVDQVITLQKIQIAQQVGQMLGQMGQQMRALGKDFEETNPEIAGALDGVGRSADVASSALNGIAGGAFFGSAVPVVGTAAGAIIGGTLAAGTALVKQETEGLGESLKRLSQIQNESAELQRRIQEAYTNFEAKVLGSQIEEIYEKQTEALRKLLDQLDTANQRRNAEISADTAARDRKDAAAIRAGTPKEDVLSARAQDDGMAARTKIKNDLAQQTMVVEQAWKDVTVLKDAATKMANKDGANPADIQAANEKRDAALAIARKLDKDLSDATALSRPALREIDEKTAAKTEALAAQKAERLEREAEQQKRKADQEAAREAREAEKTRVAGLKGDLAGAMANQQATAKAGGAEWLARGEQFDNPLLKGFGKALSDGTNEKEIAELSEKVTTNMGKLGKEYADGMRMFLKELESQQAVIADLKGQIKNSRSNP